MENYSVLMTLYKQDTPSFFILSVNSMLQQTTQTNDFVLVCDGDLSDELNECIAQIAKETEVPFNIVRLSQNVGLGKALSIGLPLCKNEFVARMDDDDIARPERCETEIQYLTSHPEVSVVSAHVNEFEDTPNDCQRTKRVPIGFENIRRFAKRRNPINHSAVMLRKSKVIEAGNYSEMRTNQDVELWVRMLNNGHILENIDDILVDFRFNRATMKRRKDRKNVRLMVELWHSFWHKHYCSFFDFCIVIVIQVCIHIMPIKLLNLLYRLR